MQPLEQRLAQANALLSPLAVPLGGLRGREYEEQPDTTRFPFQRDRDRIIHTQAFRRLKGKTQVFIAGKGDHYRTRLAHTMEVTQISRDMARTLRLNEDLAECIALAHDLGHTPFGHAGEEVMHQMMQAHGGSFEHNAQSLRIVVLLEERTQRYPGLNLNREVLEGLMKHRTPYDGASRTAIDRSLTLEAQIVNRADEIAYTAHDVDDGLRAGVFTADDLLPLALFVEAIAHARKSGTEVRGSIIDLLVRDAYAETEHRLAQEGIRSLADVERAHRALVAFSEECRAKLVALRKVLEERFYQHPDVLRHSREGRTIIQRLFRAYEEKPPEKVRALQRRTGSPLPDAVKDYIAGMTDGFATSSMVDAMVKGGSGGSL